MAATGRWDVRRCVAALALASLSGCSCLPEERCDGWDNDWDGVLDNAADGGPLTRPCPLAQGVCARAQSACVEGVWLACDYGPDYQLTERACDGLDNDCDGRIDVSWKRQLLAGDGGADFDRRRVPFADGGGWGTALLGFELSPHVVVPTGEGPIVSLPGSVLVLSEDLEVRQRITLPLDLNSRAYLFPAGEDFVRVGNLNNTSVPGWEDCLYSHRVRLDGGTERLPDAGVFVQAGPCRPGMNSSFSFAAVETDGGWLAVSPNDNILAAGQGFVLTWAMFLPDGGLRSGELDAGPVARPTDVYAHARNGEIFVTMDDWETFRVLRFALPTPSLEPILVHDGTAPASRGCNVLSADPLTYACYAPDGTSSLFGADGGLVLGPLFGGMIQVSNGELGAFGRTNYGDAGSDTSERSMSHRSFDLAAVRDGGFVTLTRFSDNTVVFYFSVNALRDRLLLATFVEDRLEGRCSECSVGGFYGQYVCAPPP